MTSRSSRRRFLSSSFGATAAAVLAPSLACDESSVVDDQKSAKAERDQWMAWLHRVADPVLKALSEHRLRQSMPLEAAPGQRDERAVGTHLEAFARLLAGLAPWLELQTSAGQSPEETSLQERYRSWSQQAIASAVDPSSPDFMNFGESGQTLVDSSFLALALFRAPRQLLDTMESRTRTLLIAALEKERKVHPPQNNWLLFAALNELLLRRLGVSWDRSRVDDALRKHQSWYLGDGTYGDGPEYHADFYNSFVIHPYLLALMDELHDEPAWTSMAAPIVERARRYAIIQERSISPTGDFPVIGRSITYRGGAFHLLADVARRHLLPAAISPAGVRCALTAVQQRTLNPRGTFSSQGWLLIGLAGHQPSLGEKYISTGSLYLCSCAWIPLGLDPADPFWSGKPASWTQKSIWSGHDALPDHALDTGSSKT